MRVQLLSLFVATLLGAANVIGIALPINQPSSGTQAGRAGLLSRTLSSSPSRPTSTSKSGLDTSNSAHNKLLHGSKPFIPKELPVVYRPFYQQLQDIKTSNMLTPENVPHVVVITDLAVDCVQYDDVAALMVYLELHRLGFIILEAVIANFNDQTKRARLARGILDVYAYNNIPVGLGTKGYNTTTKLNYKEKAHEFSGTGSFMSPDNHGIMDGQALLLKVCDDAKTRAPKEKTVTLLLLSSLMDAGNFVDNPVNKQLLARVLSKVVLQGNYLVTGQQKKQNLVPDLKANNNNFSPKASEKFHSFMYEYQINSTVYTKIAATSTPIEPNFFKTLQNTGVVLADYLSGVQLAQDKAFWELSNEPNPKDRFQPTMDSTWFLDVRTTFYDKWKQEAMLARKKGKTPPSRFPSQAPTKAEWKKLVPMIKVVVYDALAALGTIGDDIMLQLKINKEPQVRKDAWNQKHKIIGIVPRENHGPEDAEENFDKQNMANAIMALMYGSLMNVPPENKKGIYPATSGI
ncbi:hypothetical protein B0O99DRAFT_706833 [Bisporella sp. PMI_857]|nr:hypothetical protein B0O99DRAFT_706833 [Bisporella sp. PMI_857]